MIINKEYRDLVKKVKRFSNKIERLFVLDKSGVRVRVQLLTALNVRNVAAEKANQIRVDAGKNKIFTYWGF